MSKKYLSELVSSRSARLRSGGRVLSYLNTNSGSDRCGESHTTATSASVAATLTESDLKKLEKEADNAKPTLSVRLERRHGDLSEPAGDVEQFVTDDLDGLGLPRRELVTVDLVENELMVSS